MSELQRHIYEKDIIVIGGNLEAFLYAYVHELPTIYVEKKIPFRFDQIEHKNLRYIGLDPNQIYESSELWARLNFFLGLSGLLPMSSNATSIRIVDNELSVITKHSRNIKFNFNKLVVFDDEKVFGLLQVKRRITKKSRVFDWVNVRSGCSHDILYLHSDAEFVKDIIFYPTDRSDNRSLKDLVAISHLTNEQINDFNYSDTMAKFKIIEMMKEAGIKGARNGRDVNNPDKFKYYSVKVEPAQRVIERNVIKYYDADDRFEFVYDSVEQLLDNLKKPQGYLSKVSEAF